jgi:hypothetical protein
MTSPVRAREQFFKKRNVLSTLVDFDHDKTSSKNISQIEFFLTIFFSMTKNPQISKKIFKTSISDQILTSKQKKPEYFCHVFGLM